MEFGHFLLNIGFLYKFYTSNKNFHKKNFCNEVNKSNRRIFRDFPTSSVSFREDFDFELDLLPRSLTAFPSCVSPSPYRP